MAIWGRVPLYSRKFLLRQKQLRWITRYRSFCYSNNSIDNNTSNKSTRAIHCGRLFSSSSDSSGSPSSSRDYRTNDGLIVGVWVFCRHGDRTPSRALCPQHRLNEEAGFWINKLPTPDTITAYESLSKLFPPDIHPSNNNGRFLDVGRNPFGFVTQYGMQQMKENGHRFYNRYRQHGYRRRIHDDEGVPTPIATGSENSRNLTDRNGNDFLNDWDVTAYSTNYLRTVLSVQSFLDGLLSTNAYDPMKETRRNQQQQKQKSDQQQEKHEQQQPEQQQPPQQQKHLNITYSKEGILDLDPNNQESIVPDHAYVKRLDKNTNSSCNVPITVRDQTKDTLNAFDRDPDLMAELVSEVMMSKEFQEHDATAAPLAARIANVLPGLARRGRTDFSKSTPSGINWVEVADHFVCRTSHQMNYTKFTDFEHDDRVEQTLSAMSYQTLTHLAWRFRQWYKHPVLLSTIAGPPLREIATTMATIPTLSPYDKHPFVLYSCHDVTLLALLYGLGAEFISSDNNAEWRYWPNYASTLVIELVQIDSNPEPKAHQQEAEHQYVVRILLNGEPIRSVDILSKSHTWDKPGQSRGNGPMGMLLVSDFNKLVDQLEKVNNNHRF